MNSSGRQTDRLEQFLHDQWGVRQIHLLYPYRFLPAPYHLSPTPSPARLAPTEATGRSTGYRNSRCIGSKPRHTKSGRQNRRPAVFTQKIPSDKQGTAGENLVGPPLYSRPFPTDSRPVQNAAARVAPGSSQTCVAAARPSTRLRPS